VLKSVIAGCMCATPTKILNERTAQSNAASKGAGVLTRARLSASIFFGRVRNHGAKIWMITGTSRRLGAEIATAVLAAGDKVVATARKVRALEFPGANENLQS